MHSERWTWARAAAVFFVLAAGVVACGGFVESDGSVSRLTVGAEGGRLTSGSFALAVPAHALAVTVTLSAQRVASDAPAGPAFVVGPDHVTFDIGSPAGVELAYDQALYPHVLEMFAAVLAASGWQPLATSSTAPGTPGIVRGLTTAVGTFGVINCPGGVCAPHDGGATDGGGHD